MAELSVEELARLARNFLIGKGGEAELEDTKRAMDSDPQAALEFLQQMQTALDDVAPSGFNPAQWKEIDNRVASLSAPLAKSGFGLGFLGKLFGWLFKSRPKSENAPARIKRKGAKEEKSGPKVEAPVSLSADAVVAPPSAMPTEGMEDEAPIAPQAPAPAPAAAAPAPQPEPAAPRRQIGPFFR